jgi:hypothetical protein
MLVTIFWVGLFFLLGLAALLRRPDGHGPG